MKKSLALVVLFALLPLFAASPAAAIRALLGPNVRVYSPGDDVAAVNREIDSIFKAQHHQQFGRDRHALLFLPGDYSRLETINVGYYTQVLGLGRLPTDVRLPNVKTPCALPNNNATCNFWVGIENVTITEKENNDDPYFAFQWAVSQAAPARRLLVERKAVFDWFYGWASGGFVADSVFKKPAGSLSQQQYYMRNNRVENGVFGINWNNFIQGCEGPVGATDWATGGKTTVLTSTDVIREKPFLFVDDASHLKVFVPALRHQAVGPSWNESTMGSGKVLDVVNDFYVAEANRDSAKTINAALAAGKHILFTPGVYYVESPIQVTQPNTVVLGIGEATIVPENDTAALICSDVDGVILAGLIFDAERASRRFVVIGEKVSTVSHAVNPIFLVDLVYRVGGTGYPGRTEVCLEINANDTIIDHTWVWRADHGKHTGWYYNTAKHGIVVNGANVTGYGLFVEHFQSYDILWQGENGRSYFLQNEKCYDPVNQAAWMSHKGRKKGYAAYKVADTVKKHYAVGLGIYDVLINTGHESVFLDDAIEVPDTPGVVIENACIVELSRGDGPKVGINHIINGQGYGIRTGKDSGGGYAVQRVVRYSNGKAEVRPDDYRKK